MVILKSTDLCPNRRSMTNLHTLHSFLPLDIPSKNLLFNQAIQYSVNSTRSLSRSTPTSMFLSLSTWKKVVMSDLNSLRSMLSSPFTSSRLKMSWMSSAEGYSPPTRLITVLTARGNSALLKRWFLSLSNSLKIF